MKIAAAVVVIVGIGGAAAGCNAHVTLPAPPMAGASLDAIEAYQAQVAPAGAREDRRVIVTENLRTGHTTTRTQKSEFLALAGGQRVYAVEDLTQVIGRESACGERALAAAEARDGNALWGGAGGGLAAGALVVWVARPEERVTSYDGPPFSGYVALGMGAAALVSFGVYALGFSDVDQKRDAAFACYGEALDEILVGLHRAAPRPSPPPAG